MCIFRASIATIVVAIGLVFASSTPASTEINDWSIDVTAQSTCANGSAIVQVSFANHGTKPTYASSVDRDSSVYANLGEIGPGQTAAGVLALGKPSTPEGLVFFDTELVDGTDAISREAVYKPIDCTVPTTVVATTAKTAKVATPTQAPVAPTTAGLAPAVIEPRADARGLTSCDTATGQYHLRVELTNSGFIDWTVVSSSELPQLVGTPIRQGTAEAQMLDLPGTTKLASFSLVVRAADKRKLTITGAITPTMDGKCAHEATTTTLAAAASATAPSTNVATTTTMHATASVSTKVAPISTKAASASTKAEHSNTAVQWLLIGVLIVLIIGMSWLNSHRHRDQDEVD